MKIPGIRPLIVALSLVFCLSPTGAFAITFTAFDGKSLAMGGAGVAETSEYPTVRLNPASAAPDDDSRQNEGHVRPILGARLDDRDNFVGAFKTFKDNNTEELLQRRINRAQRRIESETVTVGDLRQITRSANNLLDEIVALSDKPASLSAAFGIGAGSNIGPWGVSGFIQRTELGGALIRISPNDENNVRQIITFVDLLADIAETRTVPPDVVIPALPEDFSSTLAVQGGLVTETGIAVARRVPGTRLDIGLTLKTLRFDSFDYIAPVEDASGADFNDQTTRRTNSDLNADFGLLFEANERIDIGLTVRNLIGRSYLTVLGNQQRIKPAARFGLRWRDQALTLLLDFDLTRNDALGFDEDNRFLSTGIEYRLRPRLRLRGGFRYNIIENSRLYSIGVGVGGRKSHFDFGLAGRGDALGFGFQGVVRY